MIRTHKIRLHPTKDQEVYFAKAAGIARFCWNWALAEWNRQYEAGEKPTSLKLKKQFNEIRREQFPFTWEVAKNACDQPFLDLGKAWKTFFKSVKTGKKHGKPQFKRKKGSKPSFYLANDQFEIADHTVSYSPYSQARLGQSGRKRALPGQNHWGTRDKGCGLVVHLHSS